MSKTIKMILNEIADGERGWIHDQLDGTGYANEKLKGVDNIVSKALFEIEALIEQAKPEEYEDYYAADPIEKGEKMGYNEAIHEYQFNIKELLK